MGLICPTITAYSAEEYQDQIQLITSFSDLIHIDLMDGYFAKPKSVDLNDLWWPSTVSTTLHLMYDKIVALLPSIIALNPDLVIVHSEANDDVESIFAHLKNHNIGTGIALFQETTVQEASSYIQAVDHVMLFSGKLGSFGGKVDPSQLQKIDEIRSINPNVEIGWDGGVTSDTAKALSDAGVDVLYVGGAIHRSNHPQNAYRELVNKL